MFKVLCEFLTRLKATSWLTQVTFLEVFDVDELIFIAEHTVDAFEAYDYSCTHSFSLEVFQASQRYAQCL